ncbi:MAG: hypothetical protein R2706_14955 [Acidimicrobiales bacterium]
MVSTADEGRRLPVSDDASWCDQFAMLGVGPGGCIWFDFALRPQAAVGQFRAVLLRPEGKPLVLVADELALPRAGLEFRGSGIWVEAVCETPLVHWSFGLEAFALALDSPTELAHTGMGHREPFGWELEFEVDTVTSSSRGPQPWGSGYTQTGELHGVILTDDGETPWAGRAIRGHIWGPDAAPPLQLNDRPDPPLGWVAVPGWQAVTVGQDAGGVSVI